MSNPCYYISSSAPVLALLGKYQNDQSLTSLDRPKLAASFVQQDALLGGTSLEAAISEYVGSNGTVNAGFVSFVNSLKGLITANGAFSNRGPTGPAPIVEVFVTHWEKPVAGTAAVALQGLANTNSYSETTTFKNPVTNTPNDTLYVALPVAGPVRDFVIHITATATKNSAYVPCTEPVPPEDPCEIQCEDENDSDSDCDDEECYNVFARGIPPASFFQGSYRFA